MFMKLILYSQVSTCWKLSGHLAGTKTFIMFLLTYMMLVNGCRIPAMRKVYRSQPPTKHESRYRMQMVVMVILDLSLLGRKESKTYWLCPLILQGRWRHIWYSKPKSKRHYIFCQQFNYGGSNGCSERNLSNFHIKKCTLQLLSTHNQ